jgi:hypothetical protein
MFTNNSIKCPACQGNVGWVLHWSWSEPVATSAPIQDEAVQVILGMNQKHILFPCPGIFQPLSLPPKFSPPTFLTSFPTHFISRIRESSLSLSSTKLQGDMRHKAWRRWRGESKRSVSSQMQKWEKKSKLPPFSRFFFFSMVFFLCVFFSFL